jgi:hypothetical protein
MAGQLLEQALEEDWVGDCVVVWSRPGWLGAGCGGAVDELPGDCLFERLGEDEESVPKNLRAVIRDHWLDPEAAVMKKEALTLVDVWESARTRNNAKAKLLQRAIIAEGIATGLVAIAVVLALSL